MLIWFCLPQVKYLGETHQFTATQFVATYLGKLRDITSAEIKSNVSDVLIAVPGWYADIPCRALIDATYIAGLNPLRLINDDYAAVVLGWGITKSDLPEEGARSTSRSCSSTSGAQPRPSPSSRSPRASWSSRPPRSTATLAGATSTTHSSRTSWTSSSRSTRSSCSRTPRRRSTCTPRARSWKKVLPANSDGR
jgi:hypothetical protein